VSHVSGLSGTWSCPNLKNLLRYGFAERLDGPTSAVPAWRTIELPLLPLPSQLAEPATGFGSRHARQSQQGHPAQHPAQPDNCIPLARCATPAAAAEPPGGRRAHDDDARDGGSADAQGDAAARWRRADAVQSRYGAGPGGRTYEDRCARDACPKGEDASALGEGDAGQARDQAESHRRPDLFLGLLL
jgi:hypothetical protein